MRGSILSGVLLLTLASSAAEPVGMPISAVTVPIESVTVAAQPLVVHRPQTQVELAEQVRTGSSQEVRVAALGAIQDQEEMFRMIFKPGEDKNVAIRVAAIDLIAEIDIVKVIAAKCQIQDVRDAANRRLAAIYATESDRTMVDASPVVSAYAKRLRAKQK